VLHLKSLLRPGSDASELRFARFGGPVVGEVHGVHAARTEVGGQVQIPSLMGLPEQGNRALGELLPVSHPIVRVVSEDCAGIELPDYALAALAEDRVGLLAHLQRFAEAALEAGGGGRSERQ